ncbi:MAG: mobile mystery protein B [Spirochaetales bacterium]|nr:mobile mystery protein B [Spirochaetales bacterium]
MGLDYPEGATPLDPNEFEGLIPTHITNKAELDRWEQDNIIEALTWLKDHKPNNVLNEKFIRSLHKRMFCDVWKWAGQFRTSDKNLGGPWFRIAVDLKILCNDVEYWVEHQTFSEDEIAARFHHRLVLIHPFPNGNGRHARLAADILLEYVLNKSPFSWGRANLLKHGNDRKKYIVSLTAADNGDYSLMLKFVRS